MKAPPRRIFRLKGTAMKNTSRFAVLLGCISFAIAPASAGSVEIGINRTLLSAQSQAVQKETLDNIQALGATWLRDGPSSGSPRGITKFVDEVRQAKQRSLKVLMIVSQMDEDFDNPAALPPNGYGWKEKKLSQINLDKYDERLRRTFGALKAANLEIDAVEFGSEFDAYAYDADVPKDRAVTPQDVQIWLRGYARFLKTGAEVLHDPRYFPSAKIITFGIAHGWAPPHQAPRHIDMPAKAVAMLRNVDGFNYLDNASYHVDGYGTHLYPSPNDINAASRMLHEDAAAFGPDKPIWVTEWGFLEIKAFPNKKGQTLSQCIKELLDSFDQQGRTIRLGPLMFYRYDVWLTDAEGKLLPQANVLAAYAGRKLPTVRP